MDLKSIVFDLDGVLWDSVGLHTAAFKHVLRSLGIYEFDYTKYAGMATEDVFKVVFREHNVVTHESYDEAVASAVMCKRRLVGGVQAKALARPEVHAVLSNLSKRFKLGLASAASYDRVNRFVTSTGIRGYFRYIVDSRMVVQSKPDPEIYLRACAGLVTPPNETLVVEDAAAGVISGREAGAWVCGITGTLDIDALLDAGAHFVIRDLTQLEKL